MTRVRAMLLTAVAMTTMTLTACGTLVPADRQTSEAGMATEQPSQSSTAEGPGEGDPQASTSPDEAASDSSDEAGSDEAASAPGKTTKAGTRLQIGEQAILPYRNGTIGITVTAVEKGDPAELEREFGARAKGIVPYFIRYTVANVDGEDRSFASAPYLQPVTATGGPTGAVVTGSMDGCERESAPKDFAQAGATFETCRLTGARSGVEIVGAEFDDDTYRDKPVVWRR
ncbi:hypothetical protein GCM10022224_058400 [Nonomuraea antimicrobica]|uniref:Lipoprotein n=2 Tax=Nonomuraea antimicrobica TaxID=561173 RepID=A0ABP7CEW5_9ACTN